jgi:hypothetical protein
LVERVRHLQSQIKILHLPDIVKELRSGKTPIKAASGSDLLELMSLATAEDKVVIEAVEAVTETAFES